MKKTVVLPLAPPLARIVTAEAIEPDEIIEITVRPLTHDGNQYYIDYGSSKLYNKHLKYVGRWNAKSEKIDSYPDSE
jgi:hypothetical protein